MVETGGLENRFTLTGNGGSNPSPSASVRYKVFEALISEQTSANLKHFWL